LLRAAVGLLLAGSEELSTSSSLIGVDRYLAALATLLLRTAVKKPSPDLAQVEQVRLRTDAIIYEQAADPNLTPATIAAQLNVSLRQLYRAFNGTESPAARIRRRRLERAAEILAARSGPGHVERVAIECGFASAEYFSRAFRREFGLSPRAYRSAHRDNAVR
jgi:AraC-like DNA-binding protein